MSETKTNVTHYEVQKVRRKEYLAHWEKLQRSIVRKSDVIMVETPRRMKRGVMVSADANVPSLNLDAVMHEIESGTVSTVHRHSWDAFLFITDGQGWTEVDGKRYEWKPWDTIYIPSGSWHRHGGMGTKPATFTSFSVQPLAELLGLAFLEDAGDTPYEQLPPRWVSTPGPDLGDPYSNRLARLQAKNDAMAQSRVLTAYDDIRFRVTPRGGRSGFTIDQTIGHVTGGLTAVIHQLAPGRYQSRHRHGGEAWLYCVTGEGYTIKDDEKVTWSAGDLVIVDHWSWHQHFNASTTEIASIIRIHNFDTLYFAMAAMLQPMNLFEELPTLDAPDLTGVVWPDPNQGRPQA